MSLRIGYQGEPGAYSEEAALALFSHAETVGQPSFRSVFDALGRSEVDIAVVPVENSLAGPILEVNDLLWEESGISVHGEHLHPIRHCLLGPATDTVTRAISHPQALAQCRDYLARHGIAAVPFYDTAGAARHLAENPEPGLAAIASAAAAQRYGLQVLEAGIQDDPSNCTRFLVVRRGPPLRPEEVAKGSKGMLALMAAHRPGSLVTALTCFADRQVNLTRLDSRPLRDRPFQYLFYLDFEIDVPIQAEAALKALEMDAAEVKLFGCFPADA